MYKEVTSIFCSITAICPIKRREHPGWYYGVPTVTSQDYRRPTETFFDPLNCHSIVFFFQRSPISCPKMNVTILYRWLMITSWPKVLPREDSHNPITGRLIQDVSNLPFLKDSHKPLATHPLQIIQKYGLDSHAQYRAQVAVVSMFDRPSCRKRLILLCLKWTMSEMWSNF